MNEVTPFVLIPEEEHHDKRKQCLVLKRSIEQLPELTDYDFYSSLNGAEDSAVENDESVASQGVVHLPLKGRAEHGARIAEKNAREDGGGACIDDGRIFGLYRKEVDHFNLDNIGVGLGSSSSL